MNERIKNSELKSEFKKLEQKCRCCGSSENVIDFHILFMEEEKQKHILCTKCFNLYRGLQPEADILS